jgi:hypothetical protein
MLCTRVSTRVSILVSNYLFCCVLSAPPYYLHHQTLCAAVGIRHHKGNHSSLVNQKRGMCVGCGGNPVGGCGNDATYFCSGSEHGLGLQACLTGHTGGGNTTPSSPLLAPLSPPLCVPSSRYPRYPLFPLPSPLTTPPLPCYPSPLSEVACPYSLVSKAEWDAVGMA